jgi:hypothetical protein
MFFHPLHLVLRRRFRMVRTSCKPERKQTSQTKDMLHIVDGTTLPYSLIIPTYHEIFTRSYFLISCSDRKGSVGICGLKLDVFKSE